MSGEFFAYAIVGGGLAAASAIEGIRELDENGLILLIGEENQLPYDRPPLTKKLWFGKKTVEQIFLYDRKFYDKSGVTLELGVRVAAIDPERGAITDSRGKVYQYKRLLLATGGTPRRLPIPGVNLPGVCHYRYLHDYLRTRAEALEGRTAVILGGGFIGSEIAAALNANKLDVTMIFPSPYLCGKVFPDYLGESIGQSYQDRGIRLITEETPTSISRTRDKFTVRTSSGRQVEANVLIAGIGVDPAASLAENAGLQTGDGIVVNEYLQTSHPDIYAAGDNALFPYEALGRQMRVEHWDNARNQGKWAGRNMAGARERYTHMPYFFSDLFEFGYEAVGDVSSSLETFADWQKENDTGVVYYLKDSKVRGAMMCNVWDKVEAARQLIRQGEEATPETLGGRIK